MRTAPLTVVDAWSMARRSCSRSCFCYHATWRPFRQAGVKSNPRWHLDFYQQGLAGRTPARVLVCGSSDETMPQLLTGLLPRAEVTVADACPTPLRLIDAWADWAGADVVTARSHAPGLVGLSGPFDVIVTDGLLSLLPGTAARDALLARWAELLAGDGVLLYTTRLAGPGGQLEFDKPSRAVQALAAATWPAPPAERVRLARERWQTPSRPAPYKTAGQVADAFRAQFKQVRVFTRAAAPTLTLAAHPAFWAGRGSVCVGVVAALPREER
ncbi:hypothetical protein ACFQVD_12760 [Streptosporangium amethystogenes subsp. fukuiense]|uniref:Class I SAM-dependent methyltransferase n=1 Tax=Streptosporangium amethystogenes subsp. fukuiense TaxID=698418 RepID=A0ABW2SXT4_9ACTN